MRGTSKAQQKEISDDSLPPALQIMLMENTLLLLLGTRFLQADLRNSLIVTGAVMSGSVIGKNIDFRAWIAYFESLRK